MNGQPVAVYGCGGHGKVVLDILLASGASVAGFLDGNPATHGTAVLGFPVLGDWDALPAGAAVALGIGSNAVRERICRQAQARGISVVNAIHPRATVSRFVTLGTGVVVMAGAVINPGTTVGDGVCVNTGATVDHDCVLHAFCQVWPGAHLAGSITVGARAYVGTGAAVVPGVTIGADTLTGAGTAIIADLPANIIAAGVPARALRQDGTHA